MTIEPVAAVSITTLNEDNPTALYCHYEQELTPQDCHVELDLEDGELSAGYNPEIGNAIPMSVYHRTRLRWGIPCLTAAAANELMREIAPYAQRILDGATVEWDGSNHVGVFTDDAAQAEEHLIARIGELELTTVQEYDAGDWFAEGDLPGELTADTTDEDLEAIVADAERIAATMQSDVYTVLFNTGEYLAAARERMRDEVREELDEAGKQYVGWESKRNGLIRRVKGFGDSDRYVAALAGLSHTAVQNISKQGKG